MTYWTQREPIQEDKGKRKDFIKAGLEEMGFPDEELADRIEHASAEFRKNFKIRLRTIKPQRGGKYW